jgi:hypothetical protein
MGIVINNFRGFIGLLSLITSVITGIIVYSMMIFILDYDNLRKKILAGIKKL